MTNNFLRVLLLFVGCLPLAYGMGLIETYDLAYNNDPVFQESRARRDSSEESRYQAIAKLLPTLSASGSTQRTRLHNKKITFQSAGNNKTQNFWTNSVALNLTQPVFRKNLWVELDQSENQIAQAYAEFAAAEQNLMVRTTEAYLDVLLAEDSLRFSTAEKLALARQLEQAQQRFEVGLIAITDVLEAQAGYDNAVADEIAAENELDNTKEALREIIGPAAIDLAKLGEELPLIKPDPENINTWSEVAQNQNLSIIAEKNKAEVARKNIELQQAGHYPSLDITGSYTYQDDTSAFGLRGDTARIGLQLNIPFFEGGGVSSRVRQAHHDYQAAKHGLATVERSVIRQVKNGYRGVISTLNRVKALAATVKSSESAVEATEAGLEVGTRTMVDVVAEQRNLFRSKRDHAETRYNYIKNWIQLKESASELSRDDLVRFSELLTE